MAKLFAAIDVGSYEVGMKIVELSRKNGIKQIDYVRHRIELGTDTYKTGKISQDRVDELCETLLKFREIMDGYRVEGYRACGTSAIRETENTNIIIEQIKLRTGLRVEVLSNSEQRFLHYKAIASQTETYEEIMNRGTLVLDVGGGSIQLSLFENRALVTTQNIRLGILRMRDSMADFATRSTVYEELLMELIDNQLDSFKRLYMDDGLKKVESIVIIDDYISHVMNIFKSNRIVTRDELMQIVNIARSKSDEDITRIVGLTEESASLLIPSIVLLERIFEMTGARYLWAPGISLADGIAYEYAQAHKFLASSHDFENDAIECARKMAVKFHSNIKRNELVENIAEELFNSTRRLHGMGKRELLLLRIAAVLNDCGRYISLEGAAEAGYSIIMASEILGLSHAERQIIACIVRYNKVDFDYYDEMAREMLIDKENYLTIAKLSALFRMADGICRSYRTKVRAIKAVLKERQLQILVDSDENISLEKRFFRRKSDFFTEVFSIEVVLKYNKKLSTI
ncbi:MAG TPA: exopolyphosphatase [Lachnospiraceae bacterium]|nr:exopolyphosphatase [Lachnospiraceae bacterium]